MTRSVSEVPRLPAREASGHKGTYGTLLLVAGSESMLGAAILAARGALRGGAGLVRACLPAALRAPFTIAVPCATTAKREDALSVWLQGATAVVVGPGLGVGELTRSLVRELCAKVEVPMALDADALNLLAPLEDKLEGPAARVLTPHPGEAARLLDRTASEINADRQGAALELARRSGHVAVLKGSGTVVTDGERVFVCSTGNPGMATGGSGDVLAGLLGALLAQGMAPFDAARLAVHAHGAAGDRVAAHLSQVGLIAEDLPLAIAEVLGE